MIVWLEGKFARVFFFLPITRNNRAAFKLILYHQNQSYHNGQSGEAELFTRPQL